MLIGSQQRLSQIISEPQISIGTKKINRLTCSKTLRILIDENIYSKNHIDHIIQKNQEQYQFRNLETFIPCISDTYFDYCSLILNNCSNILKDRLPKLHHKAGHIITCDSYHISATYIYTFKIWVERFTIKERRTTLKSCPKNNYWRVEFRKFVTFISYYKS